MICYLPDTLLFSAENAYKVQVPIFKGTLLERKKIWVLYCSDTGRFHCDYIQHTADILVRLVKT